MFYVCSMSGVHVIWFRRDLRVHDHAALAAAVASGAKLIPLYIFEPGAWAQPGQSRRQFEFVIDSLKELDAALQARGSALIIRTGEAVEVLSALHRQYGLAAIHMHEDLKQDWSLQRDRAVRRWARNAGISLREQSATGLLQAAGPAQAARPQEDLARQRHHFLTQPRIAAPETIPSASVPTEDMPIASDFGLGSDDCPKRQSGGRASAVDYLRTALTLPPPASPERLQLDRQADSIWRALSAPLAFGTLSLREVWQSLRRAADSHHKAENAAEGTRLELIMSGLLQRYAPLLPAAPPPLLHRPAEASSPAAENDPRFVAWANGKTGFPLLDAAMRSAADTGWLDLRLRRFVIDFARHHLRIETKPAASKLAALMTDGDIGAHYMGTRVPNPVRVSREIDPDGTFIRLWLPEIASLPENSLHTPWEAPARLLSQAGIVLGQDYPMRIVDHVAAAEEARNRIGAPARRAGPHSTYARRERVTRASRAPAHTRQPESSQLSFDLAGAAPALFS